MKQDLRGWQRAREIKQTGNIEVRGQGERILYRLLTRSIRIINNPTTLHGTTMKQKTKQKALLKIKLNDQET